MSGLGVDSNMTLSSLPTVPGWTYLRWMCLLLSTTLPEPLDAQGIVVDQGTFRVSVAGREIGTEKFAIRRAGVGRDEAFFATGEVVLGSSADRRSINPLLRANSQYGTVVGYQLTVTGRDSLSFQMTLAGRRYVALTRSALGDEEREFAARASTRVLEVSVAHHYFFLHDLTEGDSAHIIEPQSGSQATLSLIRRSDDRLMLDGRDIESTRFEFQVGDQSRVIWYDRLGRVLRVEIPASGYVAERTDLVG